MIKQLFLLAALLAVASPVLGDWAGGLRVRFGIGLSGYFMKMPRSISEAKTKRWLQVARPTGAPLPSLVMYCPSDYIFCVMFDDTEYIAGLQIALPKDRFTDNPMGDWETQGYTSWSPADSDSEFWTISQYFVDEAILATDLNERLAKFDRSKTIQSGKIWLTGYNKELLEVSTKEDDVAHHSDFTEQACIPLMGRHYYYNMTAETECNAHGMYPWFPLAASGEVIGTGFVVFGKLPELEGTDYFERPPRAAVKLIVPRGPECLYDLASNPGLVTMHIYYINNPVLLTCIFQ